MRITGLLIGRACPQASYQIRKIACCTCARNAGNVFPVTNFKGNRGGGENVPGIPGACATFNFSYLARGPWTGLSRYEPVVLLTRLDVFSADRNSVCCHDSAGLPDVTSFSRPSSCSNLWQLSRDLTTGINKASRISSNDEPPMTLRFTIL